MPVPVKKQTILSRIKGLFKRTEQSQPNYLDDSIFAKK